MTYITLNSYLNFRIWEKAIWLKNNGDEKEVILKCPKNLNENLNEFLKEWDYHKNCLNSSVDIVNFYGFTKDPKISKYAVVMAYANNDLMKRCWNEDPLKRPSSKEVLEIIKKWIIRSYNHETDKYDEINDELKTCYTSRLLNFTSKKLNEIIESEDSQASIETNEMLVSEDLNDYIIKDLGSLDTKTDEN
ncbi:unnamed protein product [Rhizophagus irregularis]|nr:unnamed protein product [Rhizophagus irregularis]